MASVAARAPKPATRFDRIVTDRVLAGGAVVMLAFVITAVARGHAQWAHIPWPVWVHLATMGTALVLTPVMLLRAKGTRSHRVLGWTWAAARLGSASLPSPRASSTSVARPGSVSSAHCQWSAMTVARSVDGVAVAGAAAMTATVASKVKRRIVVPQDRDVGR